MQSMRRIDVRVMLSMAGVMLWGLIEFFALQRAMLARRALKNINPDTGRITH